MQKRLFTYEEAIAMLPEVQRRTATAVAELDTILGREPGEEREPDISSRYQQVVSAWAESILSMGIEVKGLWLIDFDTGSGYYCWRYPEPALQYFHEYEEGLSGRIQLN